MKNAPAIPAGDLDEFGHLPLADRNEVLAWLDLLESFRASPNKALAISDLRARYMGKLHVTKSTVYRKAQQFETLGWRGLVNGARQAGQATRSLPEEFIQFWQGLCLANQRKIAPAYRALFFDYLHKGLMIPGYGGDWRFIWACERRGWRQPETCPYMPDSLTPAGWGLRNLRRYSPDVFSLTAVRIGTGAAAQYLPRVPTTRVGLRPGQFLMVDDMVHDILVNFAGNAKAYTPLQLAALDLFTGKLVSYGLKPVRELDNGEKEHVRGHYMRALLVHVLCMVGFDSEGVTILGEHATATLPADDLARINRWAAGRVSFEAGGIQGAPIARGLFDGRPRGNFKFKAALESLHNLLHNELAHLPGQKGMDRDHAPEEMYGRDKENRALVKVCIALQEQRPDLVQEVAFPYMQFDRFREFVALAYQRVNERLDHNLEGFELAGLTAQEYRMDPSMPWMPMSHLLSLPPATRDAVEAVLLTNRDNLVNCRLLSPSEAWDKSAKNLTRLSIAAAPDILGPDAGRKVTVNERTELVLSDPDYRTRQHVFTAQLKRLDGITEHLPRGKEIVLHLLSPIDTSYAFASTPDGAFLGVVPAITRATRGDMEALHKSLGIRSAAMAHELNKLAPVAEAKLRERDAAAQQNVMALTGRDPAAEITVREDATRDAKQAMRGHRAQGDMDALFEASPARPNAPTVDDGETDLAAIF